MSRAAERWHQCPVTIRTPHHPSAWGIAEPRLRLPELQPRDYARRPWPWSAHRGQAVCSLSMAVPSQDSPPLGCPSDQDKREEPDTGSCRSVLKAGDSTLLLGRRRTSLSPHSGTRQPSREGPPGSKETLAQPSGFSCWAKTPLSHGDTGHLVEYAADCCLRGSPGAKAGAVMGLYKVHSNAPVTFAPKPSR